MVRSSLDLPGALGRVGLPSPTRKAAGGSTWLRGGPLLATLDKLTSCCFFHASRKVFASAGIAPRRSPSPIPASLPIYSFHFFGRVQGSVNYCAWRGECRGGPIVAGCAPVYPQPRPGFVQTLSWAG